MSNAKKRVKRTFTKYDDPAKAASKMDAYFEECDKTGKVYDEAGLCLCLGISKSTLHRWYDGTAHADDPMFQTITQNAFLMIEDQIHSSPIYREKGMQGRAIFLTKQPRFSDYKDRQEQSKDVTVNVKFGNGMSEDDFD